MRVVELGLFEQVADALGGMVPAELGTLHTAARRWGIKVWLDAPDCPREHYEAQVIGAKHVPEASVLALEVGFHAEHPDEAANEAAVAPLVAHQAQLRDALDGEAVIGPFLGRRSWRRASETWVDPDLADPELCFELADRLATYVAVIEPLRGRVGRGR
jgi:hypothetical protein